MHLLLTGGCGFIGSNFLYFLARHRPQWRVTNLDLLTYSGNPDNLALLARDDWYATQYRFVQGDVCDLELVRRLVEETDAVVHMAAESHVDRSIKDGRPFVLANVLGTQTLLDALRQVDPGNRRRLVHVSTDEVFGDLPLEATDQLFTEESPLAPSSPYAASKAASDMLVMAYVRTHGTNACVTNCSNNFGPRQFPEKVIPLFITNLLQGRKVPLYGDGRNVRDWLHVDDHCEALVQVLEHGQAGRRYCIGGNNERSNLELTRMILQIMGMDESWIEPVADRPGHDRRYAIDSTRISTELHWRPTRSQWPHALEETVRWYREHPQWWQRILSGAYREDAAN